MVFNFTDLDLESRFGFLDDPNTIFSPYTTSITARRTFDSGVGLHLATSRNLAESAGIKLVAKKNESGLIDIDLTVEVENV